jgi:hypothetical protein
MREEDKMMVKTYFNSMLLSNEAWWFTTKDDDVNFHLLQTPKKVKPFSKTRYIYKPSVVSESVSLKPGTAVRVVGVTEGVDAGSTAVKVMCCSILGTHQSKGWDGSDCSRLDFKQEGDAPCNCELPIEEMPEDMRNNTFIVLLSDLGK